MSDAPNRIEINPAVLQGRPVVEGTRIPVSLVLSLLAGGMDVAEVLAEYPTLAREDVLACVSSKM
jgi:uncharacterized protein (DUF433 family)